MFLIATYTTITFSIISPSPLQSFKCHVKNAFHCKVKMINSKKKKKLSLPVVGVGTKMSWMIFQKVSDQRKMIYFLETLSYYMLILIEILMMFGFLNVCFIYSPSFNTTTRTSSSLNTETHSTYFNATSSTTSRWENTLHTFHTFAMCSIYCLLFSILG